jgi:hypothetical protein
VRGTIFNELDDDRLHNYIDFSDFEERFKIGMSGHVANGNNEIDGLQSFPSKRFKKPENVSLLEHTRLRNIGKRVSFTSHPDIIPEKSLSRFFFISHIAPKNGNAGRESDNGGKCSRFESPFTRKCGVATTYGTYRSRGMCLFLLECKLLFEK